MKEIELLWVYALDQLNKSRKTHPVNHHWFEDNQLIDIMRYNVADEEKVFPWWSYRNRDWKKSNRGRRLDHIWVTKDLLKHYRDHSIYTNTRDFIRPSDHVPVMIQV